ncbi:MAG: hypothetical protein KGJ77_03575, partial [Acidobacteriota bacterium]|nr:hypothetical protein [Acidobacteriota bacterium]
MGDTHEGAPSALGAVMAPAPAAPAHSWQPTFLGLGTQDTAAVDGMAGAGPALAGFGQASPVRTAVSRMAIDALGLVLAAVVAGAVQAVSHGLRTGARMDSAFGATEARLLLSLPVLLLTLS